MNPNINNGMQQQLEYNPLKGQLDEFFVHVLRFWTEAMSFYFLCFPCS